MNTQEVQNKLNNIGYHKEFTVIFTKTDGTQRKITGYMEEPKGNPKQSVAVPIVTEEGWKSFRLDSVLEIVTQ
jgi:hypothetical protein